MPVEITQRQNNFFPCLDGNLQQQSGYAYLSSPYPSVKIDKVDISNNISSLGGQTTEETISFSVESSLTEALVDSAVRSNSFSRWYENSDYTDNLRIRFIICFGGQGLELDYISQRMNEYQSDLMSLRGASGATEFFAQLIRNLNRQDFGLVSPVGPFGNKDIVKKLKTTNKDKVYYSDTSSNQGIVLCDAPINQFLKRDKNGKPLKNKKTTPTQKNTLAPNSDSLQSYVTQTLPLNPVVIKIGKNEEYTNTDLSRIRVYSFTYFDNAAYLEDLGIPEINSRNVETTLVESGMGFITKLVCRGGNFSFEQQQRTNFVGQDIVEQETINPDISKLTDSRTYQTLKMADIKRELNRTTNSLIRNASSKNKVGRTIKNDNFFSELWVTRCEDDYARYGFVFDKLAYLVENSQLPFLYQNINTSTDLLLGGGDFNLGPEEIARCINVTMSKRQMRKENSLAVNDLTFGRQKKFDESYYRPEEIVDTPQEVDSLTSTFNVPNLKRLVFYEGYDTYRDEFHSLTSGVFQYAAEFTVYDPSIDYIRKIVKKLQTISRQTTEVFDMIINSPPGKVGIEEQGNSAAEGIGLYDSINNERIASLNSIGFGQTTAKEILLSGIEDYVRIFLKLSGPMSLSMDALVSSFSGLINRKNPQGIKEFADTVDSFKRGLELILDAASPKDPNGESTTALQKIGNSSNQTKMPITTIKKYFDELYDFGTDYQTGYLYLSEFDAGNIDNPNGLPTFSKDFFDNRRLEEFNKYFNVYPAGPSANSSAPVDGTPYELSSYQYFTPKTIKVFGKERLIQTDYKATNQNIVSYDLNRYAEIFASLAKIKNLSQKGSLPFVSSQQDNLTSRGVFDTVSDSLFTHGCVISEGTVQQFSIPTPGDNKHRVIKMTDQGKEGPEVNAPRVVSAFLGGEFDTDEEAREFLQTTEKELAPFVTGTYGAVLDPSSLDKSEEPPVQLGLPPTKLSFAIFGELELDRQIDAKSYMQETFNSLVNNVNSLGIDEVSVQSSIESDYISMPNQYKSMFVLAASQKKLPLFSGFDAVRPKLEEADMAPFVDSISYVSENEEFPPYQTARDPMKTYAKFLAFWMNYKQIAVIEYLDGFEDLDTSFTGLSISNTDPSFSTKTLRPMWKKFTPSFYNNNFNTSFLCRIRNISKNDLDQQGQTSQPRAEVNRGIKVDEKDFFDLPIYNRYFILRG